MTQATLELVAGRLLWGTIRDAVGEAKFRGHAVEVFEGSGVLDRKFIIKGDPAVIMALGTHLRVLIEEPPKLPRKLVQPDGSIEYRTIDKSEWGEGPWQDEPDKVQWTDAATGLPCLMVRNHHAGHWCGYAGVALSHPAYGLSYEGDESEAHRAYMASFMASLGKRTTGIAGLATIMDDVIPRPPTIAGAGEAIAAISVHGGLTYANGCDSGDEATNICHLPAPGAADDVWWFGFDCHHAWDFAPGTRATMAQAGIPDSGGWGDPEDVYRDVAYVKAAVADLARQLAAIT